MRLKKIVKMQVWPRLNTRKATQQSKSDKWKIDGKPLSVNALKPKMQEEQKRPLFSAVKDAKAKCCGDRNRLKISWKDGEGVCKLGNKELIVLNKEMLQVSWKMQLEDLAVNSKLDAFLAGTC